MDINTHNLSHSHTISHTSQGSREKSTVISSFGSCQVRLTGREMERERDISLMLLQMGWPFCRGKINLVHLKVADTTAAGGLDDMAHRQMERCRITATTEPSIQGETTAFSCRTLVYCYSSMV